MKQKIKCITVKIPIAPASQRPVVDCNAADYQHIYKMALLNLHNGYKNCSVSLNSDIKK